MQPIYLVLPQKSLKEVAQSLGKIDCVAVVRKKDSRVDQVPPVLVVEEALVFCAWKSDD